RGEYFRADLLKQVLPASCYRLQHRFTSGAQVDALVMLKEGWVAVDAKFPLENFRRLLDADGDERRRDARRALLRDVKSHVDDIARKYIQPQEGTLEFAVMYIPAENVYYEIMLRDGTPGEDPPLLTYALEKRVFPVSPTSFYAYLLSILVGLRGLQVEQRAREIQQRLGQLRGDLQRFDTDFDVLGKHLRNAAQKYEDAGRRLEHLRMRLQGADQEAAPELETAPEREPLLFPVPEERE
ncbi:MAG: DNA recombination protein RmuC, partial [Deltaproteobacteria bacterium]|nr:DNA recombination protein RmuC [Deltaproteobacteria bacterium]